MIEIIITKRQSLVHRLEIKLSQLYYSIHFPLTDKYKNISFLLNIMEVSFKTIYIFG